MLIEGKDRQVRRQCSKEYETRRHENEVPREVGEGPALDRVVRVDPFEVNDKKQPTM